MFHRCVITVTGLSLLLLLAPLRAGDLEVPRDGFEFDAELTGRGEKMNYGPFLAYSLINGHREPGVRKKDPGRVLTGLREDPKPTLHLKAINIHLGGKYTAAFDTELCGYAAVWTGGFLNLNRTNLNGYKGDDLAYLRFPVLLQNGLTPGGSLDGTFRDPRPAPYGNLPREQAHYTGLYLHGHKTILAYTVSEASVLEMPAMLVKNSQEVFCRTIRLTPPARGETKPFSLLLGELPAAKGNMEKPDERRGYASDPIATLKRGEIALRASFSGAPKGSRLLHEEGRLILSLPALHEAITFRVFIACDVTAAVLRDIMKASGSPEDLPALCKGGPSRWKETIAVRGKRGPDDAAYTVDTIPLPDDNPWGSWMRPGAFDFFPDGRVALGTWSGDVWIGSGLDDGLQHVVWKRFATGLFEPMGLKIVGGVIHVLGRDQITKLHDLDGDGEADFYENFNSDGPTAPSFHSFAMELQTDRAGNFYYTRGAHRVVPGTPMHGGVIKVAKDGSKAELICTGLREPNSLAIGPDDSITVADNQGNWVPSSKIDFIKPGAWYGYVWGKTKEKPEPEKPLCWIPMSADNSSGSQAWVSSKQWGPLQGHLLHTSYGASRLFKVLVQRDGERFQGGVVAFPLDFSSGIMRAVFHPKDGQLYVCGLKGWGTNAKTDGCFQRVRHTGKTVTLPLDLRVSRARIAITFATPLDRAAVKPECVAVEQWNYRWTEAYGSKDYCVGDPNKIGRDAVAVKAVSLSDDGKTLILEIPDLKPVMQMGITLTKLRAIDGTPIETTIYNTINYVP